MHPFACRSNYFAPNQTQPFHRSVLPFKDFNNSSFNNSNVNPPIKLNSKFELIYANNHYPEKSNILITQKIIYYLLLFLNVYLHIFSFHNCQYESYRVLLNIILVQTKCSVPIRKSFQSLFHFLLS
jgi:hypothetical protein